MRQGKIQAANEFRQAFERLADNPQARLAEIKYTRMGPKAEVQPLVRNVAAAGSPSGPVFAEPQPLDLQLPDGWNWRELSQEPLPSITVCDIDGDNDVDLFLASSAIVGEQVRNVVAIREGEKFYVDAKHALAAVDRVNAVAWGDFDNDGHVDAYFARSGPNQLWKQVAAGQWQDVTESSGTSGGDVTTTDTRFVDADHDGDLDLYLVNAGPNLLLNNNLDGTFRPLGAEFQLPAVNVPSRRALFTDLDDDRDADLIVIHHQPPHEVHLNDRLWEYRSAANVAQFIQAPLLDVVAIDANADGQVELYSVGPEGVRKWQRTDAGWQPTTIAANCAGERISVADVRGDGTYELLVIGSSGLTVLNMDGTEVTTLAGAGVWQIVNLSAEGPGLIRLAGGQSPEIFSAGKGRHKFVSLSFTGKENKSDQMRSNRSGIGVDAAVRVGSSWTAISTFQVGVGPGQNLQPVAVGLGNSAKIDFVRLTWPDGVFQTEMSLAPGSVHRIEETQRQVSSCPIVFAWNGTEFAFVTDVLGVGGIGFNLGRGEYGEPRPWEHLLLPDGSPSARDGQLEIRLAEPMEEACYLDSARLSAYDLPPGWDMTLDERFNLNGPPVTGQPLFFRQQQLPETAVNDRGQDVLAAVREADFHAAPPGKIDSRFIGRTEPHSITLGFPEPIDHDRAVLVFDGWVEYPYSQTMFAAWQAKASYDAPTIEARDSAGNWHTVVARFGYMAGMPRQASVPLDRALIPPGCRQLRISSNLEIYCDRIRIVSVEPCDEAIRQSLALTSAEVVQAGFPRRHTLEQRRPFYDYARRDPLWDTRHMTGFYTSFGPVLPLVESLDDALAIIGPGEEIRLCFLAPAAPTGPGARRYVLELNGWTKDMDLMTRDGDTLAPLPARSRRPNPRREELHQRWNQRFQAGN
jgi:hypothetical protein